jgi:hypothetical protein
MDTSRKPAGAVISVGQGSNFSGAELLRGLGLSCIAGSANGFTARCPLCQPPAGDRLTFRHVCAALVVLQLPSRLLTRTSLHDDARREGVNVEAHAFHEQHRAIPAIADLDGHDPHVISA